MSKKSKPPVSEDQQPYKPPKTIVIGGSADGEIVTAGAGKGQPASSDDWYILAPSEKGGDRRFFYLLVSLQGTDWEERAFEVWEYGTPAALIEARPQTSKP